MRPSDLIQGTLDVLILKSLATEPRHGWAIAKRIESVSGDVLQIKQGSLYPALHRLEGQGLLRSEWRENETGRDAKFYSLTKAGRAQLAIELGISSAAMNDRANARAHDVDPSLRRRHSQAFRSVRRMAADRRSHWVSSTSSCARPAFVSE